MLSSYCFSLRGRDHIKSNMPCHDASQIETISSSWKIAVVADGVGSCKHAELASGIAVKEVTELIKKQFPPGNSQDQDYIHVIHAAMHGAANAIEAYVEEQDPGNESEYQTTLAVAVMSSKCLYYGNAGDSGIISLDEGGSYHLVTKKQNDDMGRVYAIPSNRLFEVGKADHISAAVLCMTDGIYDTAAPLALRNHSFPVNVPFVNMFVTYGLGLEKAEERETVEKCKNALIRYLQSEECKMMTDDLSVAALINTNSDLQPEEILWEEPKLDFYTLKWEEVSVYPSAETRNKLFKEYICEKNPDWSEEQVLELLKKYAGEEVSEVKTKPENEPEIEQKVKVEPEIENEGKKWGFWKKRGRDHDCI